MKVLKEMDAKKVARVIEDDAGCALPGLRRSLEQAKAGKLSRIHTPEQIVARQRSEKNHASGEAMHAPAGMKSLKEHAKINALADDANITSNNSE